MSAVQTAVVQEPLGLDLGGLEVLEVGIVDQQDLAGFLDVDDELGPVVAGEDRGNARFGVIFLLVVGHAAGRLDLFRLQRCAVHDDVLRRPICAGDGVFVLPALHLRGLDRARFGADLDFGHGGGLFHPQVDHVDLAVTTDDEEVAARGRQTADVDCVAGVDDGLDLIGGAVDQCDLTRVAQRDAEQVFQIPVVFLLRGPVFRGNVDFPGFQHLFHAEFRRSGGVLKHVFGHQIDLLGRKIARGAPVRHARGGPVGDEALQVFKAQLARQVRGQRLAGRTLAQDAMAAGAAFEIDLVGFAVFVGSQFRDVIMFLCGDRKRSKDKGQGCRGQEAGSGEWCPLSHLAFLFAGARSSRSWAQTAFTALTLIKRGVRHLRGRQDEFSDREGDGRQVCLRGPLPAATLLVLMSLHPKARIGRRRQSRGPDVGYRLTGNRNDQRLLWKATGCFDCGDVPGARSVVRRWGAGLDLGVTGVLCRCSGCRSVAGRKARHAPLAAIYRVTISVGVIRDGIPCLVRMLVPMRDAFPAVSCRQRRAALRFGGGFRSAWTVGAGGRAFGCALPDRLPRRRSGMSAGLTH